MLVATKDKVISLDTVGYADIAAKKKMEPNAMFWIASMTKPMTATALMMLVDEGKVNVDDPVEKYLPEFKGQMVDAGKDGDHPVSKKPGHPILVRNILSHTSGLPPKSPKEKPTRDMLTLRDAAQSYAACRLQFDPGSSYKYCNAGINTAGRIIEVVSGMPYEQFMSERLFKPLGMTDTTFVPSEEQVQRLAKVYKANAEKTDLEETTINQLFYPLTDPRRQPMPAGGLFSTASDVVKFAQMILNNGVYEGKRYVSEAAVKQMSAKQTGDANKANYGFGWQLQPDSFGHNGAYRTNMTIDPQNGFVTVFMAHRADGWPDPDGPNLIQGIRSTALKLVSDTRKAD